MRSRSRVLIFLFVVLGGQWAATLLGVDAWPLSSHPMFAEVRDFDTLRAFRVEARTADGRDVVLPYTNWPSWWNYIEHYCTSTPNGEALRAQMLFDFREAQRSEPDLKERVVSLRLIQYQPGEKSAPLQIRRHVAMQLDPSTGEYRIDPRD